MDIKNIFENLRSCLDYLAKEIFESECAGYEKPKRLYFPIRDSPNNFYSAINQDFPGLKESNNEIYDFLESVQPYNDSWLGDFNELNNENKHQNLVEQIKTEFTHVTLVKKGLGSVKYTNGAKFGPGVKVLGVPIDPVTQLPVPNNEVKTEITKWVDFKFVKNQKSVLPFIKKSIKSVDNIYNVLSLYL